MLEALQNQGSVEVYQTGADVLAMAPATYEDGAITLTVKRALPTAERAVTINAQGRDPAGNMRTLASVPATFEAGSTQATAALSLPAELRARITRFDIAGQRSAGATTLVDDALRRREVGLIAGRENREGLELLSPLHYIEQALAPAADLIDGALGDVLPANPDVIVLADIATLSEAEQAPLLDWIEAGGMLVRFAGPRIAASDISRDTEDPLMPVRLRSGGRSVGGAMSWGAPKTLDAFRETSPFFGLEIPEDVTVSAQVVAQPDPVSCLLAPLLPAFAAPTRARCRVWMALIWRMPLQGRICSRGSMPLATGVLRATWWWLIPRLGLQRGLRTCQCAGLMSQMSSRFPDGCCRCRFCC